MEEEFIVEAGSFQGPLDLMLHLVKEQKLEPEHLDMARLADQYIRYIRRMQDLHLEVASAYLVELAAMIEYKSRMLLPRQEIPAADTYEEDQRDRLVARLLEYQAFKEAAQILAVRQDHRALSWSREPSSLIPAWQKPRMGPLEPMETAELAKAMHRVLRRRAILQPYETRLQSHELSTEKRRSQLMELFKPGSRFSFEYLCADCTSRHMVIVTFLAVLDLMHDDWLYAETKDGRIWLGREGDPV